MYRIRGFLRIIRVDVRAGLAVGVAFGSIGKSPSATFEAATVLAIGIGLQNFPEGLAVSLPMHREKRSKMNSFFWGQMSGAVEPIGKRICVFGGIR